MLAAAHAQKWLRDAKLIAEHLSERGLKPSERLNQLQKFLDACFTDDIASAQAFGPQYLVYCSEYLDFVADLMRWQNPIDLNTLRRIFAGAFDTETDEASKDDSRNLILQLRTAVYLSNGGFKCAISGEADVLAEDEHYAYVVQCKRVYSYPKVKRNIFKAAEQIEQAVSQVLTSPEQQEKPLGGIVWLDLTPLFLELRALVPVVDAAAPQQFNLQTLRQILRLNVSGIDDPKYRHVKFIVAQGSSQFVNIVNGDIQYRVATTAGPTPQCNEAESRHFDGAMAYLEGYRRGPDT